LKILLKEQDGSIRDSYYSMTKNLHGNPSLLKGEDRRGCIPPSPTPSLLQNCHISINLNEILAFRCYNSKVKNQNDNSKRKTSTSWPDKSGNYKNLEARSKK
jgi:hypothetical protein